MAPRSSAIELLVRNLERAFRQSSWHGPNLRGSIRGVDLEAAAWRPQPGRHNIWEFVVHAAYWKYRVYRHLTVDPESFDLRGSNFFERPQPELSAASVWSEDLQRLDRWHDLMLESVRRLDDARLAEKLSARSSWSFEDLIAGAAAHDVYHAGQIRLIRRMLAAA